VSSTKYKSGDHVVCRSDDGIEGLVTPGKKYEILTPESFMSLASALGISSVNPEPTITIKCDDGKNRAINKLRFVPATETVLSRGKLELVRQIKDPVDTI
jgi:hypothetical protein